MKIEISLYTHIYIYIYSLETKINKNNLISINNHEALFFFSIRFFILI
jgi:hypothetical protein